MEDKNREKKARNEMEIYMLLFQSNLMICEEAFRIPEEDVLTTLGSSMICIGCDNNSYTEKMTHTFGNKDCFGTQKM